MKRYDEKVLQALLDSYENSLLYTGKNKRNQTIYFPVKKSTLPEYFDESSLQFDIIHDQLLQLEEKGFVRLVWKGNRTGHILEKCALCPEKVKEIYAFLHREPRARKEARILEICKRYSGQNETLDSFLNWLTDRISQEESIAQYASLDQPEELDELCKLIRAILENREEVFLREFSVQHFGDSKLAEKRIQKASGVIARFSAEESLKGLSEEQVLEECNILKNPSLIMLKGCGKLKITGACAVDLECLGGGIGLTSRDIEGISWDASRPPGCVLTIENLTSFHRFSERGTLAVYLGGYHNRVKRCFLQNLYQAFPDAVYEHFGDLDCGGFLIWKDLCAKTGIPFSVRAMDEATYLKYEAFGKPLTEHDRKELAKMAEEPFFAGQRELFLLMQKKGYKLEQECVRGVRG